MLLYDLISFIYNKKRHIPEYMPKKHTKKRNAGFYPEIFFIREIISIILYRLFPVRLSHKPLSI